MRIHYSTEPEQDIGSLAHQYQHMSDTHQYSIIFKAEHNGEKDVWCNDTVCHLQQLSQKWNRQNVIKDHFAQPSNKLMQEIAECICFTWKTFSF